MLSSFRVGKMLFFVGKDVFLQILPKVAKGRKYAFKFTTLERVTF